MVYVECLLNSTGKSKILSMFILAAQRGERITTLTYVYPCIVSVITIDNQQLF